MVKSNIGVCKAGPAGKTNNIFRHIYLHICSKEWCNLLKIHFYGCFQHNLPSNNIKCVNIKSKCYVYLQIGACAVFTESNGSKLNSSGGMNTCTFIMMMITTTNNS